MKKVVLGIIIGIGFTFGFTTYAADITTLVGKTVQGIFPVTVDGDVLPKTAIVIDGTSYLPVRAIADALGMDITFNADLGIELTNKEAVPMTMSDTLTTAPEATPTPTVDPHNNIGYYNGLLTGGEQLLNAAQAKLKALQGAGLGESDSAKEQQGFIDDYTKKIAELKEKIAALTQ